MFTDYKCDACQHVWNQKKKHGESWPKIKCPTCKSDSTGQYYSKMPMFDVPEGKVGNAANGYSDNVIAKPSIFTPEKISRKQVGTDSFTGDKRFGV